MMYSAWWISNSQAGEAWNNCADDKTYANTISLTLHPTMNKQKTPKNQRGRSFNVCIFPIVTHVTLRETSITASVMLLPNKAYNVNTRGDISNSDNMSRVTLGTCLPP